MNPTHTKARLTQVDKMIKQMEDELRDLKKERVRIKVRRMEERKKK